MRNLEVCQALGAVSGTWRCLRRLELSGELGAVSGAWRCVGSLELWLELKLGAVLQLGLADF